MVEWAHYVYLFSSLFTHIIYFFLLKWFLWCHHCIIKYMNLSNTSKLLFSSFAVIYLVKYVLMHPVSLKGCCCLLTRYSQYNLFMRSFWKLLKYNPVECIALNVNFYDLGYDSSPKGGATLCISSWKLAHSTNFV